MIATLMIVIEVATMTIVIVVAAIVMPMLIVLHKNNVDVDT